MDGFMTKLRSLAAALLFALAPAAALADDYRFEVKGIFDRDTRSGYNLDVATLAGTWYFAPVSTDNVPLAEAAFLGRASSLSAIAAQVDLLGTHTNAQRASVGYYIPGTMLYAGVRVSHDEDIYLFSSTTVLTEYRTNWSGTLGIAPLDGLLVTTDIQEHGYDPNITARYVGKLPNNHFYAGSVNLADHGGYDGTSYGLDFDYYFDDSTSLGLGFDDVGNRWELRGEKFFSKSCAAGVSAYTNDFTDGFGVHVTWRH
jgi:Putative general bacterial porin